LTGTPLARELGGVRVTQPVRMDALLDARPARHYRFSMNAAPHHTPRQTTAQSGTQSAKTRPIA
jgi:hypothetical protein